MTVLLIVPLLYPNRSYNLSKCSSKIPSVIASSISLPIYDILSEILGINKRKVTRVYESMNIHKRSDILIDSYDIMNVLNISEGPILSDIWKELEREVLNGDVDNERNELLFAVKKIYTSLVVKEEELNERETSN